MSNKKLIHETHVVYLRSHTPVATIPDERLLLALSFNTIARWTLLRDVCKRRRRSLRLLCALSAPGHDRNGFVALII